MMKWVLALLCLTLIKPGLSRNNDDHQYTNDFAVEIDGDYEVADLVASLNGFTIKRHLKPLGNHFHFVHDDVSKRSKRSANDLVQTLMRDPNVIRVEQQRVLDRHKRGALREKHYVIHDKQKEFDSPHYDPDMFLRGYHKDEGKNTEGEERKDLILEERVMVREMGFDDPLFGDQWYIHNEGQTGVYKKDYDINVIPVWKKGITGKGSVVCILDDGVDHNHPDIAPNYDERASADFNEEGDDDPMPDMSNDDNNHGTRCAGEVASAANNGQCGVGVAYNCKIGGVRMLDGIVTDLTEARAVLYENQYIEIYSASWGPRDDAKTVEGPGHELAEALKRGVQEGRSGLGSIYVWATGNGGGHQDDCSCDGYVSSIETISIGSISHEGESTYYSEVCPSTHAVIWVGGSHEPPGKQGYENVPIKIVTTDTGYGCVEDFQGTSAAAPLAAGCFALVLEANRQLTWRDLQNLVVETARVPNTKELGWNINGGGYHVNHKFGFGAIDCGSMVEGAQQWTTVPDQHTCAVNADNERGTIPVGGCLNQTLTTDGCDGKSSQIDRLEHVQVHLELLSRYRGDLNIWIKSPSSTASQILSPRPPDDDSGEFQWSFMTVHNWGENPRGEWTLSVCDKGTHGLTSNTDIGELLTWSMTLYGTEGPNVNAHLFADSGDVDTTQQNTNQQTSADADNSDRNLAGDSTAHEADHGELKQIMEEENEDANDLNIAFVKERELIEKSQNGELTDADLEVLARILQLETENEGPERAYNNFNRALSESAQKRADDTSNVNNNLKHTQNEIKKGYTRGGGSSSLDKNVNEDDLQNTISEIEILIRALEEDNI